MADLPFILIRADASPQIGVGHVMRSRTLGEALADMRCEVQLCGSGLSNLPVGAVDRLELRPIGAPDNSAADALQVVARRPDLVLVDGYHFSSDFFNVLQEARIPYGIIDDNFESHARQPGLILNPNAHASPEIYGNVASGATLLLGLRYALIRREVSETAQKAPNRSVGTVFVAMGGSDPLALTEPVVEAILQAGLNALVALGPAALNRDARCARIAAMGAVVVHPEAYVQSLATAQGAVLAAGSSLWEAAALDTPTVAIVVAENQRPLAAAAIRLGFAEAMINAELGQLSATDQALIVQTFRRANPYRDGHGSRVVDGLGARRAAWEVLRFARSST